MKFLSAYGIFAGICITVLSAGCGTQLGRDIEKQVVYAKDGVSNTSTNIDRAVSSVCGDAPKVSERADEVVRLVSSEEKTLFIVDGKEMGRAKQLKVCIDSSAEHLVVAQPPYCDEKTEKLKPPYDYPSYEFRYMLAECKEPAPTTTQAVEPAITGKTKSKRK